MYLRVLCCILLTVRSYRLRCKQCSIGGVLRVVCVVKLRFKKKGENLG